MIGKNPTRNIGTTLARRAEKKFGKTHGWMDQLHDQKKGNVLTFPQNRLNPDTVEMAKQIESMPAEAREALAHLFSGGGNKPKSGKRTTRR